MDHKTTTPKTNIQTNTQFAHRIINKMLHNSHARKRKIIDESCCTHLLQNRVFTVVISCTVFRVFLVQHFLKHNKRLPISRVACVRTISAPGSKAPETCLHSKYGSPPFLFYLVRYFSAGYLP